VICAFKYLCNLVFSQLNNYGVGLNKGKIITIITIHNMAPNVGHEFALLRFTIQKLHS
jgi:hypothetical protein